MKSEAASTQNGDCQRRNRSQRRRETFNDDVKYVDYDNGYGKKDKKRNQSGDVNKWGQQRDRTRHKGYEDPKSTGMDFAGDVLEEGLELAGHAV